eukprot:scaffold41606_cov72-Phaeocystis_antarctica.AAC.4
MDTAAAARSVEPAAARKPSGIPSGLRGRAVRLVPTDALVALWREHVEVDHLLLSTALAAERLAKKDLHSRLQPAPRVDAGDVGRALVVVHRVVRNEQVVVRLQQRLSAGTWQCGK